MDARDVVAQRITTLDGLLAAPGGPFGGRGGAVAEQLTAAWRAERRLLARILDESRGGDVRATIDLWNERTRAFLERSAADDAHWRDREGHEWHAEDVLRLLGDLERRIDAWLRDPARAEAGSAAPPTPPSGPTAAPGGGASAAAPPGAAPGSSVAAPDFDPALEAAAEDDEDEDDDDDDARYLSVNAPRGEA